MLSVYSNLPKYRQLSYFELNQPKWKLEISNKWMKCFLDMYINQMMCLRKQKKLFSSADTANKIHHLKSPLMLSVYHNLLYPLLSFVTKQDPNSPAWRCMRKLAVASHPSVRKEGWFNSYLVQKMMTCVLYSVDQLSSLINLQKYLQK